MYPAIDRRRQSQNWASPGPAMTKGSYPFEAAELRRRAEEELKAGAPEARLSRRSYSETQRLLYELQVHQIELEMQNAQLRLALDLAEIVHSDLAARSAKLEYANRELEAFNYAVSHDLCTPLTSINGFSQVLMELCRDQLDEQSQGYLQGIHEGTVRMKRLIAALLDFSRVKHVEIRREIFDLSQMAKAVAAELKQAEPESRVTFLIAEGLTCNGDKELCRIVLDNLMGNAWKFTVNRAGSVIELGMTELGGKPVCFVCDNGPGFDMAHAGKLFLPFQRIPGTEAGGHGIGLATVKRIVKRHGGRVWAESSPGEGATFFYTLE